MSHSERDPQALLTAEVVRRTLDAGVCPYCSRGPFEMVLNHVSRAHGLSSREMHELAGVTLTHTFASPRLVERQRANGKRRDMSAVRAAFDPTKPRSLTAAAKSKNAEKLALTRERAVAVSTEQSRKAMHERDAAMLPMVTDQLRAGKTFQEISDSNRVALSVIRRLARQSGERDGSPGRLPRARTGRGA
jgi:hypothetical protein